MKKVILSIAMLCATSMLFAQNNESTVKQLGIDGTSKVIQDGSFNMANQYQTTSGLVDIYQQGNGNYAKQDQDKQHNGVTNGSGANMSMKITQIGDRNSAKQTQRWSDLHAVAIQKGGDNVSNQYQLGNQNNEAHVYQEGNWNNATQQQLGNTHTNMAVIAQIGDDNVAVQIQNGENFDKAYSRQYGNDGYQSIKQDGGRNSKNEGYQYQAVGTSFETATLMQNGKLNLSNQNQYGMHNTSNVSQTGDNMTSTVTQYGASNMNTVIQTN